jgi:hypothetical protein
MRALPIDLGCPSVFMPDDSTQKRAAGYRRLAAQMFARAEGAFDPEIVSSYLELAGKWLRLAEEAQRGVAVIDRTDQENDGDALN